MVLFSYNFKHRKTQDFIFYCLFNNIKIDLIVAADPIKLSIPQSTIRTKIKDGALIHPKDLANSFSIPYIVENHSSERLNNLLKEMKPEIGLISGARILKKPIIENFETGIVNFHPGLIPDARGLDAMLWSIYFGLPLAVTSHIIDERIDAGKLIEIEKIKIDKDDTLFDLSNKLYLKQLDMIPSTIQKTKEREFLSQEIINSKYNKKMPPEIESTMEQHLITFKKKFA